MTLNQLRVFVAVAETRSFSKAGERVSLAQSTTSQHIKALEEELAVRLFDRSLTSVTLTAVGKLYHQHAVAILNSCDEALAAVRRFQGLEDATIAIGASSTPATCLIPDLIGQLASCQSGLRLEVHQGDSQDVIQMILNGDVEFGIIGSYPNQPAITFQEIMRDRIILAGRPGVVPQSRLSLHDILQLPLVTRESGSGTRQVTDSFLRQANLDPRALRIHAKLGSSEAIRRVLLQGEYCAFVSALAIQPELASGVLIEIPVDGFAIQRSFYLAWCSGRTLSPGSQRVIELLGRMGGTVEGK